MKDFKKLDGKKKKNGYMYTLVKRTDKVAMYEQRNEKNKDDTSIGYEVFRITITNPYSIQQKSGPNKGRWYHYPRSEKFASNEDFGRTAWAYSSYELAEKKYKELTNNRN